MDKAKSEEACIGLFYTNFEGMPSLMRELDYLKTISKYHRLIVVICKNETLVDLIHQEAKDMESIYTKAIATKFQLEKQLIVKELQKHGINTILNDPKDLTVNTINKYLEIKARGV